MITKAVFEKFISRNERSGDSVLLVSFFDGKSKIYAEIEGRVIDYPRLTPLDITTDEPLHRGCPRVPGSVRISRGASKEAQEGFLSSGFFSKITERTSPTIVEAFAKDIISNIDKSDIAIDKLKGERINREAFAGMVRTLRSLIEMDRVFSCLITYGVNYISFFDLWEHFAFNTEEVVKKNPYILLYKGATLSSCDKLASSLGILKAYDSKRVEAIVYNEIQKNKARGNTLISFDRLVQNINRAESGSETNIKTRRIFIAGALLNERYLVDESTEECNIYLKDDYENEKNIAQNIKRLCESKRVLSPRNHIEHWEKVNGITLSSDQREAFNCLKQTGVKVITGGPGTGKTTILKGIIDLFISACPEQSITLCAPTGKAARRMTEATGLPSLTIHKLLNIRPFDGEKEYRTKVRLDRGCVIVDECSMVDTELMAQLIEAIPGGSTLIMVGDADQLASVGAGNVFSDIIASGVAEVYRLTVTHRQGGKSAIIENSKKVLQGEDDLAITPNFKVFRVNSEAAVCQAAVTIAGKCFKNGCEFKCFTPTRKMKFQSGSIVMNNALRAEKHRHDKTPFIDYGEFRFSVGDNVLFTKNNYNLGYMNGQEGVVSDVQKRCGRYVVSVHTEGEEISLSGETLDDLELAYSLTAHKAQGGETENALILIPQSPRSMLQRRLLYVEITRAKKNVIILSEGDALEKAINSKTEMRRNTGLTQAIRAACR